MKWILAISVFVVVGAGGAFGAYELGHRQGYDQGYSAGHTVGAKAAYTLTSEVDRLQQQASNQAQLNTCLDNVDANVSSTLSKATLTADAINTVVNIKNQQMQECQLRYPIH